MRTLFEWNYESGWSVYTEAEAKADRFVRPEEDPGRYFWINVPIWRVWGWKTLNWTARRVRRIGASLLPWPDRERRELWEAEARKMREEDEAQKRAEEEAKRAFEEKFRL